jgi:hypothetical protein
MAEMYKQQRPRPVADGPVLRRGRPADPPPAAASKSTAKPDTQIREKASKIPEDLSTAQFTVVEGSQAEPGAPPVGAQTPNQSESAAGAVDHRARERRLRVLLRQCERVLLFDFELLVMAEWPDSLSLAEARRRRDLWLFSATLAVLVFLSGMTGWIPAWIAGSGFGASVLIILTGVPAVRKMFAAPPSLRDLLLRRRRLLNHARTHVAHLEGEIGLAWQCAAMSDFNPALRSTRFSGLIRLSERRMLARALSRRQHVRLYLMFLLEAEKAYKRVEQEFLKSHQIKLDAGGENDR